MTVHLDHLMVPARDKIASARLLAELLGVPWSESGVGPFSPVYVNDGLTLDFDQWPEPVPKIHFCFRVSDNEFDAILARIKSIAGTGLQPEIMGMGPVEATKKALKRANLQIKDIDVMELNEAFASQALACIQEIGISADRVNLDGGAIALGHPLGATGARITGKAAQIMAREGKKFALATQCIGGGQGIATILEAV